MRPFLSDKNVVLLQTSIDKNNGIISDALICLKRLVLFLKMLLGRECQSR